VLYCLSLYKRWYIPRLCVRRRFLHIQPPSPPPLAPQSQTSVTTPLRPTLPRVYPLPQQPAVFPGGRRFGLISIFLRGLRLKREVGRRPLDVGLPTAERFRKLVELGPQAYRRALSEAVYVSALEETATNTLDNNSLYSLSLNTHTDYNKISGGKHDVVRRH